MIEDVCTAIEACLLIVGSLHYLVDLSFNAFKISSNITIISTSTAAFAPAVAASFLSFVVFAKTDLHLPSNAFTLSSDALNFPSKSGIEALGGTLSEIVCPNVWTWATSNRLFFAIKYFLKNW